MCTKLDNFSAAHTGLQIGIQKDVRPFFESLKLESSSWVNQNQMQKKCAVYEKELIAIFQPSHTLTSSTQQNILEARIDYELSWFDLVKHINMISGRHR